MPSGTRMPPPACLHPRLAGARWILGAALALLAAGCGEEPPAETPVARPVKLIVFGSGGSGGSREYPGKISAAQTAELSFDVPGTILEIPVREGQKVAKGTLLARLDARDYTARADSEKAKMTQTSADLKRYEELYREQVIPRAQLDVKKREYEVAEAAYREAAKAVEDSRLTAPFDGVVARRLAEERENVQAKRPVVTIQGNGGLEIEVNIPESDAALAKPGLSLEERNARALPKVILTAFPDRTFPARLTEFSTAADPATRTFKATLAFDVPADVNVLPGMTARVIINASAGPAAGGAARLTAPAVGAGDDGAPFVWRADPDTMEVHRIAVEVGELSASGVTILGGLEDGDLIAVTGVNRLREGMVVRRLDE